MDSKKMMDGGRASGTPGFGEALGFWARLGWISFGGTAAHLGIMHDELVERRRWIRHEDFLHGLGYCMLLPGPEAQQLAIYLGWRLHGIRGGVAAGVLFVLPSTMVLLVMSIGYARYGALAAVDDVFRGLRPAALALVLYALVRLARRSLTGAVQWVAALIALPAIAWLQLSVPAVMAGAIVAGLGLAEWRRRFGAEPAVEVAGEGDQEVRISERRAHLPLAKIAGVAVGLWVLPLLMLRVFGRDFGFWSQLDLFFTRAAFVIIGGSYTVIPYVAHAAVYHYHWLSRAQMLDGFALAETTPGPLIIVVAFVGFMAGFRHFHGSMVMGTLALLLTTLCTFLPCFLFVFGGIPWMQRMQNSQRMKAVLSLIVAVVFAAMGDLALFLGRGVLFRGPGYGLAEVDWVVVAILGGSLLLLGVYRKPVGWVLGLAFGAGLLRVVLRLA